MGLNEIVNRQAFGNVKGTLWEDLIIILPPLLWTMLLLQNFNNGKAQGMAVSVGPW